MSRGNMFLGFARGKVGDIVFARRNGQQTTRAYVSRVNDAATRAQVSQRSKLGNIVANYRMYSTLLRRAFESRPAGNTDYNVFASLNLSSSQVFLDQHAVSSGAAIVAPYAISRGTLPSIRITESAGGVYTSDIAVPADFAISDATTVAELSAAILMSNQGWQAGDQLTVVLASQSIDVSTGYPLASANIYAVVLSLTDTALLSEFIPMSAISNQGGFLGMTDLNFVGGVAAVHSRKTAEGSLKVSSQRILLTLNNTVYQQFAGSAAEEAAVLTRGFNQAAYLNPASEKGAVGGGAPAPLPGGDPRVTGFTVNGVNVLTQSTATIAEGSLLVITGVNLSPEMFAIVGTGNKTLRAGNGLEVVSGYTSNRIEFGIPELVPSPLSVMYLWLNWTGDGEQSELVKEWEAEIIDPDA